MTTFKNPENGNIEIITKRFLLVFIIWFFIFYKKKNMVSYRNKFRLGILGIPVESLTRLKVPQKYLNVRVLFRLTGTQN